MRVIYTKDWTVSVFTLTLVGAVVTGVCITVKGVVLTVAAVSTSACVMSIAIGVGIATAGVYVTVSACKIIKERILDGLRFNLSMDYHFTPFYIGIPNAMIAVLTFQTFG